MTDAATLTLRALSDRLAQRILGVSPASASRSGTFLVAPLGTARCLIVRSLLSALDTGEGLVIFAELSEDPSGAADACIASAIRTVLAHHTMAVRQLAFNLGIPHSNPQRMEPALAGIGVGAAVTLAQALAALSDALRRPIVLVIDGIELALASAAGRDTLFALKAARDELNCSAHWGLRLVFIGSNRETLNGMRSAPDQPFFLAPLIDLTGAVPDLT